MIGQSLIELYKSIHVTFLVEIYECKHYRLLRYTNVISLYFRATSPQRSDPTSTVSDG
jgi:hypothetical protein